MRSVVSSSLPDARKSSGSDSSSASLKRSDAADGELQPQPFGPEVIAAHFVVAHRQCSAGATYSSARLELLAITYRRFHVNLLKRPFAQALPSGLSHGFVTNRPPVAALVEKTPMLAWVMNRHLAQRGHGETRSLPMSGVSEGDLFPFGSMRGQSPVWRNELCARFNVVEVCAERFYS